MRHPGERYPLPAKKAKQPKTEATPKCGHGLVPCMEECCDPAVWGDSLNSLEESEELAAAMPAFADRVKAEIAVIKTQKEYDECLGLFEESCRLSGGVETEHTTKLHQEAWRAYFLKEKALEHQKHLRNWRESVSPYLLERFRAPLWISTRRLHLDCNVFSCDFFSTTFGRRCPLNARFLFISR